MAIKGNELGTVIKQRRKVMDLTLAKVSRKSGVSVSHLGRIERGERFPSARILRKIAKAMEFEESELFVTAGYLSPNTPDESKQAIIGRIIDPYVAMMLGKESVETQRNVIAILIILKSIAKRKEVEH